MQGIPVRKVGDIIYCKSFGDLHKVRIIAIDHQPGKYPYRVQVLKTSINFWIDEQHIAVINREVSP